MAMLPALIEVEIAFADPEQQRLLRLRVPEGCTAAEAIAAGGFLDDWQPASSVRRSLSCFGRLIAPDTRLKPGDRVEILRPLTADPKDQRQQRVQAARKRRRSETSGRI